MSGGRTIIVIGIIGLALGLQTGCTDRQPDDTAPVKIYRHALDGAPTNLDPVQSANIYASFLVTNLYDTLYRYKYLARPYELTPNLATGMPEVSADGLTYTIAIKPGVYFIDDPAFENGRGRELVAADFVYSIKRHFDPQTLAQGAWLWQNRIQGLDQWRADGADYAAEVSGLRALDKYTIQIRLTRPYPQLPHTLTQGFAAVVPKEAVDHYGREFAIRPVGSGPYRLLSFSGVKAVLERNDRFRREPFDPAAEGYREDQHGFTGVRQLAGSVPPLSDRIDVHFIQEEAARWNAFISGEVDHIRAPTTQLGAVLESRSPIRARPEIAEKYHLLTPLETGFVHTDFNMDDPRIGYHQDPAQNTRNKALRCAIVKAFDWTARNRALYFDLAQVFPGVIPPVTPEFDADLDRSSVSRDVEGAKALLQQHGWTPDNLPELEYGFAASVAERQSFEQFRAFMGDIGYPPEKIKALAYASFGDFNRALKQRKVMLITTAWYMDFPDAENTMQLFYGPNEAPGSNSANFRNEEFDRLYEQSSVMQASPERTAIYQRMNQVLIDECVSITGLSRTFVLLWTKNATMYPDLSFLSGHFARFVDIATDRHEAE